MNGRDRDSQISFLSTAFWILGGFCVYWETQVFAAAHRFGQVELSIFGKCFESEAVIFTLSFAWVPLLMLHLVAHQHQRLSHEVPRFPGVMGDLSIPLGLKWLRILLFAALCAWPSFVHVFLTGRAYSHYAIVPSGVVKAEPDSSRWPAVRGWKIALYPLVTPNWDHSGARWWVNSREEWAEVWRAEGDGPDFTVKPRFERITVSALPVQPILFDFVGLGLSASTLALAIGGALRRGVRKSGQSK